MLPMQRVFSILIIVGIIVWAFLLLERAQPDRRVEELTEQFDDANTTDRCAKYRTTDDNDLTTWSLGYEGRIRQLMHGCF